jgi:hypothetical protein
MKKPQFKETRGRPQSYAPPVKKGDVVVTKRTQAAVYAHAKKNGRTMVVSTWKGLVNWRHGLLITVHLFAFGR